MFFNFVVALLVASIATSNAAECTDDSDCVGKRLQDCVASFKCRGTKCEPDVFSSTNVNCKPPGGLMFAASVCKQHMCNGEGECVEEFRPANTPCYGATTIPRECEQQVCDNNGECVVQPKSALLASDTKPCREVNCHKDAYCDGGPTCPQSIPASDGTACMLDSIKGVSGFCCGGQCLMGPSCATATQSTASTTLSTTISTTSTSPPPPPKPSTTSTTSHATPPPPTTSESNAITTSTSTSMLPVSSKTTTTTSTVLTSSTTGSYSQDASTSSTSISVLSTTEMLGTTTTLTSDSDSQESTSTTAAVSSASPSSSSTTGDVLAMMMDGEGLETWVIGVIGGVSALVLILLIALIVVFVLRARRASTASGDAEQNNDNDVPLEQSAPPRANIYAPVPPLEPGHYTAPPLRYCADHAR